MKKYIVLVLILTSFVIASHAQAYEGSIQYNKKNQKAAVIEYEYTSEAVQNAIIQKMQGMGFKATEEKGLFNKDKGFLIFNDAFITEIDDKRMDYIVKVERRSRKAKDESIIYLILSKSNQNMLYKMDAEAIQKVKSFLNNLLPDIAAADLELQILAQEDVISKAEKKLKDLLDDQTNLEKKLASNKDDQEKTQKDIANQKQELGVLIEKRKNSN